jgi:hypothetical protein
MLVSSIGYFQGKSVNYTVKNQCNKNTLSEGFGHDKDLSCSKPKTSIFKEMASFIKNSFSKTNSNQKVCLSLIA